MFGTSNIGLNNEIGHCHSFTPKGAVCSYQWKRPEEDDKVFTEG